MASNGSFSAQRNANAGTTMKRRNDNRGYGGGIGCYQEERNRYAPPQKRFRSQLQQQFRSGHNPLYHYGSNTNNNVSRVSSQSYNNYGVDVIASNSSFALPNNDSNTNNYQKPFVVYGNPNPQIVPLPLPYRKLDPLDSLPQWVPNSTPNYPVRSSNFVPNTPDFTNVQNPMNHSNMVSVVSQSMHQPIVLSKELTDLLSLLNNEKEKKTSEASNNDSLPVGLSFDNPSSLNVRHESVIKSLYSDMPRQCSSCGLRFKCQEEHSKHMDWHVRKNRSVKTTTRLGQQPKKSRGWLASASLWLCAATGGETVEVASFGGEMQKKKGKDEEPKQLMVPADEDQKNCALCVEPFEEFFSHEDDDWMYKDAVYLTKNGRIVHVKCMPEPRPAKDLREPSRVMSVTVPSVAKAIAC
jgi:pre-mRNA cleavage complex 2 protein Pcf11